MSPAALAAEYSSIKKEWFGKLPQTFLGKFSWKFLCQNMFFENCQLLSTQLLIIIFTSVESMSQLVLSRSASILAQLMSSLKKFKSLQLKLLFLIWWFCFSSTIFMFQCELYSGHSVTFRWCLFVWSLLVHVIWPLLVRKISSMLFFVAGSSIKVKSSMARSLPVENLLPQNVGSIINYLQ